MVSRYALLIIILLSCSGNEINTEYRTITESVVIYEGDDAQDLAELTYIIGIILNDQIEDNANSMLLTSEIMGELLRWGPDFNEQDYVFYINCNNEICWKSNLHSSVIKAG